jgi:hypothetical protein
MNTVFPPGRKANKREPIPTNTFCGGDINPFMPSALPIRPYFPTLLLGDMFQAHEF